MATLRPDIFLIRGDTNSITVTFSGLDLTGGEIFFTAKSVQDTVDDTTAAIKVQVTVFTDPTAGIVVIPLSATDTNVTPGDYFYDVQFKSAGGVVTSIPARKLRVSADVTRRTT